MILLLLIFVSCSAVDHLGPNLSQRREAAVQAANNLNLDSKKASYLIEAYVNNIKIEEIESFNDFGIQIENGINIEGKLFLILDCFEYYKFENQVYNLNVNMKEDLKFFLRGNIEINGEGTILINKTLDKLIYKAKDLDNISKNFCTQIDLIEEVFKLYNQFVQARSNQEKVKIVLNIIFGDSIKKIIITNLIENSVKLEELKTLYEEASRILSINKNRRLK